MTTGYLHLFKEINILDYSQLTAETNFIPAVVWLITILDNTYWIDLILSTQCLQSTLLPLTHGHPPLAQL